MKTKHAPMNKRPTTHKADKALTQGEDDIPPGTFHGEDDIPPGTFHGEDDIPPGTFHGEDDIPPGTFHA